MGDKEEQFRDLLGRLVDEWDLAQRWGHDLPPGYWVDALMVQAKAALGRPVPEESRHMLDWPIPRRDGQK